MPAYSGRFQYTGETGESLLQGSCQVAFDQETCVVTPSSGAPLAFDLGDVDGATPGEWDIQLALYTGRTLTLKQFGAVFSNMSGDLLAAWRDRTVRCLLLEDLEEVGRYQGVANSAPGEIRIYRSNFAFLPEAGTPIQWRLAEVDSILFEAATYSIVLTRGSDRLVLSKLAKKTDEVLAKLQETLTSLRKNAAAALHNVFPFLSPDQLARLSIAMPEGSSTPLVGLNEIHPKLADALIGRAVDEPLQKYFDALRSRATQEPLMAGFKFARADEDDNATESSDPGEEKTPLFFWFFFALPNQLAAWEATTGTGRATYIFRAPSPFPASIASLTRGLALVNFRREPVYLPDESLDREPRFHGYAIGARKLPDLRRLRAAYVGRAVHSSPEEWQTRMDALLVG
jgi:hypothetical protein